MRIVLIATVALLLHDAAFGGLVIYYDMEGDAENVANPGTLDGFAAGDATFTGTGPASFGSSAELDGTNDAIAFGDLNTLDNATNFTVAAWYRRDVNKTGDEASGEATNHDVNNVLFANSSDGGNDNFEIGTQGNLIEVYIDSGSGGDDTTRTFDTTPLGGITNGEWYHIALTWDASADPEVVVYLNGQVAGTSADWNGGMLDDSTDNEASLGYARHVNAMWGDLDGGIDEFRLYDMTLSQSEIQAIAGIPEPGSFALLCFAALGLPVLRRFRVLR